MERRSVLIKRIDEEDGWRLLWSDTLEPADERLFRSIKEAGRVARALMGAPDPSPKLGLVKPPGHEDPPGRESPEH